MHRSLSIAGEAVSASMKLPLTEQELAEQARKLEERRVQRRAEIAEQERKAEIEREKSRRLTGKEILDAKEKAQQVEMQRYAEERRREKEDDKKARQRVKDMIEEDRRNREQGLVSIISLEIDCWRFTMKFLVEGCTIRDGHTYAKSSYFVSLFVIKLTNQNTGIVPQWWA